MQGSTSLQLPASDPPSPSSDGGAKSSRVCLNCRRKKKKCDKKLPSCGRCTYSLEFCQHEDDQAASRSADPSARTSFESLGNINAPGSFAVSAFLGGQIGPANPTISPALFAPLGTTEDIHHFVSRSLAQIVGDRSTTESIIRYYFGTINAWFTIIESASFEERLEQMWAEPSAETGLLALCMLLIVRSPEETPAVSMQNSLYHAVKTLCGVVVAKLPLSTSLLQAHLLICLYELGHLMPQQAYLTLGTCITIVRAFGWLDESFWGQDQWIVRARELKLCSILWWTVVFLESGLQSEELGYPQVIPSLSFAIPFPETFDPILQLSQAGPEQYGGSIQESTYRFANDGDEKIETIVFPEAKSASLLSQVLVRTKPSSVPTLPRETLHAAIVDHARNIVSTPWKDGSRFAALSLAYTAMLKLNYPHLGLGRTSQPVFDPSDRSAVQSTIQVIDSICHNAQLITSSSGSLSFTGPLVPTLAHSMFLAAKVLVTTGGALAQGVDFSNKIQLLRGCLEVFAKRWKIAAMIVVGAERQTKRAVAG
ncbi:hypothetical protein M406DRAFT_331026 [Cryphonectria parasitica EP155]|uniref:Zn(2)-C6 fungal-type domain-containing protein n=1 Tax=Cryphonectria parasitica (strain ATCC 38755 / EP155) TaxID=660469 RepID=A0A9P5CN16_CRYP1|nr:uncharacterized protein M406DRAFT_331026 [Cryphonectria parasitica EP155]KAF3764703.1 hypothetical protein M406DRAFT_331026 [Cryphonectria parasitica EP155]